MEHPVNLSGLSKGVERILSPDAPGPARMMAASGMAPLPPADLLTVLYFLSYDKDSQISSKASKTLQDMPDKVLLGTLQGNLPPEVLDGIAPFLLGRDSAVEQIILNRATLDDTHVWLAKKLTSEQLLEIIVANERRLLRTPAIIENLYFNQHTRMSSVDRAIELAIRNGVELSGIPAFEETKQALDGELIFESDGEPTPDDLNFNNAVQTAKSLDEHPVEEINDVMDALNADTPEEEKPEVDKEAEKSVGNFNAQLSTMMVSHKIRIAMLGTASQRSVLIRDSNKLVIMAVLKSPSVNEAEVRKYSALKGLPEEAMRYIASKRDWTKQYLIKLNLVNNPRTPIEHALRFMTHLRPNDLRALERSKDVPGVICKAAKELRKKRMK